MTKGSFRKLVGVLLYQCGVDCKPETLAGIEMTLAGIEMHDKHLAQKVRVFLSASKDVCDHIESRTGKCG